MDIKTLYQQINGAYRGTDDDAPIVGSGVDYIMWMDTINRKINEWARDGKNKWSSLFEVRDLGTITAGTAGSQIFELDDDFLQPSDSLYITKTDGNNIYYRIVKPEERDYYSNTAYLSGHDPRTLTFIDNFPATSNLIGGTARLAAYFIPEDITSDADTVPVDDPYWLVYAVASELAFNDLTYQDKAADLQAKATSLYSEMSKNNRRGTYRNPRTVPTNVYRLGRGYSRAFNSPTYREF